jgi:hypothetical protein
MESIAPLASTSQSGAKLLQTVRHRPCAPRCDAQNNPAEHPGVVQFLPGLSGEESTISPGRHPGLLRSAVVGDHLAVLQTGKQAPDLDAGASFDFHAGI